MGDNETTKDEIIKVELPVGDISIDQEDIWQQLNHKKRDLHSHCIQVRGWTERYTPLQFSAKYGLKELTKKLLKADVDPNTIEIVSSPSDVAPTEANCREYPLLLAAKNAKHEILHLFKFHKRSEDDKITDVDEHGVKNESTCLSKPVRYDKTTNFTVVDPDLKESVLHIVLWPFLLRAKEDTAIGKFILNRKTPSFKGEMPPMNLSDKNGTTIEEDCRKCIDVLLDLNSFKEDRILKELYMTQIHKIINYQDSKDNSALHYAVSYSSSDVVEKLLSLGADANMKNKNGKIPLLGISNNSFRNFMDTKCIETVDCPLRNGIMVETETEKLHQERSITFDYTFICPPTAQKQGNEDVESSFVIEPSTPEMSLIAKMCESKNHRSLITHPVIDSFLWLKWGLMYRYFHSKLRLRFLFTYCITWYIFSTFGGHHWYYANWFRKEINMTRRTFGNRSHDLGFTDFDGVPPFSPSRIYYVVFLIMFLLQIIWIALTFSKKRTHFIFDGLTILLNLAVLVFDGDQILWLILAILLSHYFIDEIVQMYVAYPTFGYFRRISNYGDLTVLAFVVLILYGPDNLFEHVHGAETIPHIHFFPTLEQGNNDTKSYLAKRSMGAVVLVCVWSRCLTEILKLPELKTSMIHVAMFYKVAKHYVKMMLIYSWYLIAFGLGFYIMLHFDTGNVHSPDYDIRSHLTMNINSTSNSTSEIKRKKANNILLVLLKISTMFLGEFDFDDLPIRGGSIIVTLGYLFSLSFIFFMIIVLMNVLNALAINDIPSDTHEEFLIQCQVGRIHCLQNLETAKMNEIFCRFNLSKMLHKCYEPRNVFVFKEKVNEECKKGVSIRKDCMKVTFSKGKIGHKGKGYFFWHAFRSAIKSGVPGYQGKDIDVFLLGARKILSKHCTQHFYVNSSGIKGQIKAQILDQINQFSLENSQLQQRLRLEFLIDKIDKMEKYIGEHVDKKSD